MAEEFFNHSVRHNHNEWRADSRALIQSLSDYHNPGPMSVDATRLLINDGIDIIHGKRYPISVKEEDFLKAELVIAMSRVEHEPMIIKDWNRYSDHVQYWDVEDLRFEKPSVAYQKIKEHVRMLFDMLNSEQYRLVP
jgi:protein-tyrosine-phosphatase